MLKFCSMHCINLGIDLWVAGSTIRMILSHPSVNIWHGHDENDRLSGAWDEFKRWTRSNRLKFPDIHWCPFYRDIIIASYRFNLNQRVWSGKKYILRISLRPISWGMLNHGSPLPSCEAGSTPILSFRQKHGMQLGSSCRKHSEVYMQDSEVKMIFEFKNHKQAVRSIIMFREFYQKDGALGINGMTSRFWSR